MMFWDVTLMPYITYNNKIQNTVQCSIVVLQNIASSIKGNHFIVTHSVSGSKNSVKYLGSHYGRLFSDKLSVWEVEECYLAVNIFQSHMFSSQTTWDAESSEDQPVCKLPNWIKTIAQRKKGSSLLSSIIFLSWYRDAKYMRPGTDPHQHWDQDEELC